jgi:hypothetical protein
MIRIMATKVNHPARFPARKRRISMRFENCDAVRLLMKKGFKWRGKQPPRSADVEWQALRAKSLAHETALIKELAERWDIRYRQQTKQFWMTIDRTRRAHR